MASRPNILFITSTRLGDAVLSNGILNHLAGLYDNPRIVVACGALPAPLYRCHPNVAHVHVMQKSKRAGHWRKLWRDAWPTKWDHVVDIRSSAIAYLLRAKHRHVFSKGDDTQHRCMQLAAMVGREDNPPGPSAWVNDQTARAAQEILGHDDRPLLAVGATSNWGGKCWPPERYIELLERLTGPAGPLPDARIMVPGAPGEEWLAGPLLDAFPGRLINLIGQTGPDVAFACLSRATAYIGNDNGLMHLASAAGIPTLGLFGPSREDHYGPFGPVARSVRGPRSYDDIIYEPGYTHIGHHSRMDDLTVDKVEQAVLDLWRAAGLTR